MGAKLVYLKGFDKEFLIDLNVLIDLVIAVGKLDFVQVIVILE